MDEENSQDELVNRSVSYERNRWQVSVLADGEDSTDEGGDGSGGSDGSREDDEVEEDEDEEDSDEGQEGALKGAEGSMAQLEDLSSDDDAEKCPICLHSFQEQPVVTPAGCQHHFCLDCLLEWSKIPVQEPVKMKEEEEEEEEINMDFDQTSCEVCGRSDQDDRLLLCDGCDAGYHMECLTPPLDAVPVEEWFCPECTANNPCTDSAEKVSEDEVEALLADAVPTTSRLRTSTVGRMRSIARTRQSERVRASVNRNRITQAHAIQHVPRYLIQTTWLDGAINAVLNSAACTHSMTSRTGTSRNRRTGSDEKHGKKRKKERKKVSSSSSSKDRTAGQDIKTNRRHIKRAKPGQKQVAKKDPAPRSCFTKSLGTGQPKQGPYRPSGHCPKVRPRSLTVYGGSFHLDPFDDESRAAEGSIHQRDIRRRGLSHSALRSHQPVARPIQHSLSRHSLHNPERRMMENTAPVPDLLGSILSGQSLLLMDSSDMVINRDGSLMLGKPACASSSKTSIFSNSKSTELETEGHVGMETCFGLNVFQTSRDAGPSHTLPLWQSSSQSPPNQGSSPAKSTSPLMPPIILGTANVCSPNPVPQSPSNISAPHPINPGGLSQRSWSQTIPSSHPLPPKNSYSTSDWASKEMGAETGVGTGVVKKAPPKPVWFDVSGLPRIPKIRRGTNSSYLDSCRSSQHAAPQGEQGRAKAGWRQRHDRAGTSSSANPNSCSTVSFCISASKSAWHTRCHTSSEVHDTTLGSVEDRNWENRRMYDPFHPSGLDLQSSDAASESDNVGCHSKDVMSEEKGAVPYRSRCNHDSAIWQTKPETVDGAINERNKASGSSEKIKIEGFGYESLPQERQPAMPNSRTDAVNTGGEKNRSRNELSQKQDSGLHTGRNLTSKPKNQSSRSRSSSSSATRENSNLEGRCKLKDRSSVSGDLDSSRISAETKGKTRAPYSHSQERIRARSSSESSLSEAPKRYRRRRRCSWARSRCSTSHSSSGDGSRNGTHNKRNHWRHNDGESRGHSRPRSRSRERRRNWMRSQDLYKSKDRLESKDCKRPGTRSLSREKGLLHSSHSTENPQSTKRPSSASPKDMKDFNQMKKMKLVSPKALTNLTDLKEVTKSKPVSPSGNKEVNKPKKRRIEKSLSGVKEELSAFVVHQEEGRCEKESKWAEKNKPDSEKNTKTELTLVQLPVQSSCRLQMLSTVETGPRPVTPHTGKREHLSEATGYTDGLSPQNLFMTEEERVFPTFLQTTYPKKQESEIFLAKSTEDLKVAYTLHCLGIRKPGKVEATVVAGDVGRAKIKDTSDIAGDLVTTEIKDTPETAGDMGKIKIKDTPGDVGDMGCTKVTYTLVVKQEEQPEVKPETVHTGITAFRPPVKRVILRGEIKDIPETVSDIGGTVIMETPDTIGDMVFTKVTDTLVVKQEEQPEVKPETVHTGITAFRPPVKRVILRGEIKDIPETVSDIGGTVIMETPDTIGDMVFTKVTDTLVVKQEEQPEVKPETVHTGITVFRPPVKRVALRGEIKDIPETVSDIGGTVIMETSDTIGDMAFTEVTDTLVVKQEEQLKVKPETVHTGITAFRPPVKRVALRGEIKDIPETVSDIGGTVIMESSDTIGDMAFTEVTDTLVVKQEEQPEVKPETVHTGITAFRPPVKRVALRAEIKDKSEIVGDMGCTKIMDTPVVRQVEQPEVKPEMGPAVIIASSTISRPPVKRVTWNLQEVDISPAKPTGMLPFNTMMQSSRDGHHTPASQNVKKLHLQERAIEEVKLAIKPFFLNKEITKEEYKEIWGKAVQKVCHSKSGEISPEKVANLVKAYVEKYKLAKKHQKEGRSQELEGDPVTC